MAVVENRELITRDLHPKAAELVGLALRVGWVGKNYSASNNKKGVSIVSPHGRKIENIPPTQSWNQAKLARLSRTIISYGDKDLVAHEADRKKIAEARARAHLTARPQVPPEVVERVAKVEEFVNTPAPAEPTVVGVYDWYARDRASEYGGQRYLSHAVRQRKWSDGRIDYVCAKPGCDYSSENSMSVATHFARSKDHVPPDRSRRERPTIIDPEYTEPTYHRNTHPAVMRKAARLLEEMLEAAKGLDPEAFSFEELLKELAERIAQARVDRLGLNNDHETHDLTPEERLERIRRLADTGEYLQAMQSRAEIEAENAQLTEKLQAAEAHSEQLREQLKVFRELLDEIR